MTVGPAQAEEKSSQPGEGIVFLHLAIDSGGVRLLDSRVAEGTLKIEKIPSKTVGLRLSVKEESDQEYYRKVVLNPLIQRYEYEDPDNQNQLKSKVVILEEAEFWVRIPYRADAKSIAFSLTEGQPEAFPKGRKPIESVIDISFLSEGRD